MGFFSENGRVLNCLNTSVFLHTGMIAAVALAPSLAPKQIPTGNGQTLIEFAAVEQAIDAPGTTPIVSEETPRLEEKPVKEVKEMRRPPKPQRQVTQVAKLDLPDDSKIENETLPEIEPQPLVAVNDSDDVIEIPEETQDAEVATAPPTPAPPTPAPPTPVVASAPKTESSSGSAQVGRPDAIQVTQTYLNLRQYPGNVPPQYTREMRIKKMQGRGQLVYFVTREGSVTKLQLTKSTGHDMLDQEAIRAIEKFRFVPGQEGYTIHNFEYALNGSAEIEAGRLRTTSNLPLRR